MTTINDILCRLPNGYNIAVYNFISGRFIDDFIWDGSYGGCKLDILYTHSSNVYKIEIENSNNCIVLNLYILDYAYISEFLEYCYRLKLETDKKVTLSIVTKSGDIDSYEVTNNIHSDAFYFDRFAHMCEQKYPKEYPKDKLYIKKFETITRDNSIIIMVFL